MIFHAHVKRPSVKNFEQEDFDIVSSPYYLSRKINTFLVEQYTHMRNRFDMDATLPVYVVRATTTSLYAIYTNGIRRSMDAILQWNVQYLQLLVQYLQGMCNICNYKCNICIKKWRKRQLFFL